MRLLSLRDINILSFVSHLVLVLSFVPFHSYCLSVLLHIASQSQRVVSWTGEPVNTGHQLLGSQMAGQQLEQLEARRNVDDVLVDLAVD